MVAVTISLTWKDLMNSLVVHKTLNSTIKTPQMMKNESY